MKKEDLKKGDILLDKNGNSRKILEIVGSLYFLSSFSDFKKTGMYCTIEDLKSLGCKVKPKREFKKGNRVLVWDGNGNGPVKRYFSHKKNGKFFTFFAGADEWTSDGQTTGWRYCELAEDE